MYTHYDKEKNRLYKILSDVVNRISNGNLNTTIEKKGHDEITNIAYSIDNMQHNIDRMMKEELRMTERIWSLSRTFHMI